MFNVGDLVEHKKARKTYGVITSTINNNRYYVIWFNTYGIQNPNGYNSKDLAKVKHV